MLLSHENSGSVLVDELVSLEKSTLGPIAREVLDSAICVDTRIGTSPRSCQSKTTGSRCCRKKDCEKSTGSPENIYSNSSENSEEELTAQMQRLKTLGYPFE